MRAIPCGGIPAMPALAQQVGLPEAIDAELDILKRARPYHDSDHVLNIALNVLSGGQVLDDIELRRNDRTFLDAIGARPDPPAKQRAGRASLPVAEESGIGHWLEIVRRRSGGLSEWSATGAVGTL